MNVSLSENWQHFVREPVEGGRRMGMRFVCGLLPRHTPGAPVITWATS
jgi:hypothetical protein